MIPLYCMFVCLFFVTYFSTINFVLFDAIIHITQLRIFIKFYMYAGVLVKRTVHVYLEIHKEDRKRRRMHVSTWLYANTIDNPICCSLFTVSATVSGDRGDSRIIQLHSEWRCHGREDVQSDYERQLSIYENIKIWTYMYSTKTQNFYRAMTLVQSAVVGSE